MASRGDLAVARTAARVVVEAWRRSGETVVGFARRYGIEPKRLGRWVRRLASGAPEEVTFHPVRLVGDGKGEAAGESRIEVVVAGAGHVVRAPSGFAAEHLRGVPAVLEGRA